MISTTSLAGLTCEFVDAAVAIKPAGNVLGAIEYSNRADGPGVRDGYVSLAMPMAGAAGQPFAEVWRTTADVEVGQYGGLAYAIDGEYLLCCGRAGEAADYVGWTEHAYLAAFELVELLGYPHVVRIWNLVDRINEAEGSDRSVYGQFCKGRALAFEQRRVSPQLMPAATCVGSNGGGIAFYFIACRSAAQTNIENPRQIPAYRYPPRYGVKSPSFARATHLSMARPHPADQLFVSGTASILGSATVHPGDVARQCTTTLENISALVSSANLRQYGIEANFTLTDLDSVKVYVKRGADVPLVRELCIDAFSPAADIAYANVDICRDDLLVEIEGIISPTRPVTAARCA